jgi:GNAT superfamily N-acetyltransferase
MAIALTISPLGVKDRTAWATLWQGYQEFYGVQLSDAVTTATWNRMLSSAEPMHGLAARSGDQVVGFVHFLFHRSTWMEEDTCYLQDVFVAPDRRGQGIARALIEAVYRAAEEAGAGQVYWQTHQTNTTARGLYDTLATHGGFIVYERFGEVPPS